MGSDPLEGGIGGVPAMPGMGGGGMHMGPNDPLFAGRMRQPGRGGHMPPGARWDPIRPPGMEASSSCVRGNAGLVSPLCAPCVHEV